MIFALKELVTVHKKDKISIHCTTIFGANMGDRPWIYRDRLPTFQEVMLSHIEF